MKKQRLAAVALLCHQVAQLELEPWHRPQRPHHNQQACQDASQHRWDACHRKAETVKTLLARRHEPRPPRSLGKLDQDRGPPRKAPCMVPATVVDDRQPQRHYLMREPPAPLLETIPKRIFLTASSKGWRVKG